MPGYAFSISLPNSLRTRSCAGIGVEHEYPRPPQAAFVPHVRRPKAVAAVRTPWIESMSGYFFAGRIPAAARQPWISRPSDDVTIHPPPHQLYIRETCRDVVMVLIRCPNPREHDDVAGSWAWRAPAASRSMPSSRPSVVVALGLLHGPRGARSRFSRRRPGVEVDALPSAAQRSRRIAIPVGWRSRRPPASAFMDVDVVGVVGAWSRRAEIRTRLPSGDGAGEWSDRRACQLRNGPRCHETA